MRGSWLLTSNLIFTQTKSVFNKKEKWQKPSFSYWYCLCRYLCFWICLRMEDGVPWYPGNWSILQYTSPFYGNTFVIVIVFVSVLSFICICHCLLVGLDIQTWQVIGQLRSIHPLQYWWLAMFIMFIMFIHGSYNVYTWIL